MPYEPLPDINYTGRDFTSIRTELEAWVNANKPDIWNDFYESNLGEFLIQLIAYHGDLLSFAICPILPPGPGRPGVPSGGSRSEGAGRVSPRARETS